VLSIYINQSKRLLECFEICRDLHPEAAGGPDCVLIRAPVGFRGRYNTIELQHSNQNFIFQTPGFNSRFALCEVVNCVFQHAKNEFRKESLLARIAKAWLDAATADFVKLGLTQREARLAAGAIATADLPGLKHLVGFRDAN